MGIGRDCLRAGDAAKARDEYLAALKVLADPVYSNRIIWKRDQTQSLSSLADAYLCLRQCEKARAALRELLAIEGLKPDVDALARDRLRGSYRLAGGYDLMRREIRNTLKSKTLTPEQKVAAHLEFGYSYLYERRYAEAREEFQLVLAAPDAAPAIKSEAQLQIGNTYFVSKDYTRARAEYLRVAEVGQPGARVCQDAEARLAVIDKHGIEK